MDPLTGGLLVGGANLLGSIFGTTQNNANAQQMQQQQIAANQAMVAQQENYQTQMSNTAYQRASADMKAAGLNPAMMFGSGSAASAPSGASIAAPGAVKTSALTGVGPAVQSAVSTATQQMVVNKTMDKMTDEIANLKTENAKIAADVDLSRAHGTESTMRSGLISQETANEHVKNAILERAATEATNVKGLEDTFAGRWLDRIGFAGQKASDALSPVGNLLSSALQGKRLANPYYP